MSPHQNIYTKTKEGYIIGVEELLNLKENLPRSFYRLDIANAADLYNWTLLSGRAGFVEMCKELEIDIKGIFDEA